MPALYANPVNFVSPHRHRLKSDCCDWWIVDAFEEIYVSKYRLENLSVGTTGKIYGSLRLNEIALILIFIKIPQYLHMNVIVGSVYSIMCLLTIKLYLLTGFEWSREIAGPSRGRRRLATLWRQHAKTANIYVSTHLSLNVIYVHM